MTKHSDSSTPPTKPLLSHNAILQINATIIAGLFILLTFQISNDSSSEDLVQEMRKLDIEESLLNQKLVNSTGSFSDKINNRIDDIKIERESVRAELTANTMIPYLIYSRINPIASMAILILPFVVSSIIILNKTITKQISDNYHAKWSMRFTMWGLIIIGLYFLYHMFPIGRFLTNQFI